MKIEKTIKKIRIEASIERDEKQAQNASHEKHIVTRIDIVWQVFVNIGWVKWAVWMFMNIMQVLHNS